MLRILKKIFLINTALVLSAVVALSLVSRYAYGTSITAMLSGFYLQATNFNYIYESEENALEALDSLKGENLKDIKAPEMTYTTVSRHVGKMQYFSIGMDKLDDTLIFYFPGGGFVDQPKAQHWSLIDRISVQTETPVILPVYLKATSYTCDEAYIEAIALYTQYVENHDLSRVIFIGDSSGGTFALSLAMQLRQTELLQPEKLILISPFMDLSMTNEEMKAYAETDYMVGYDGLKVFAEKWAGSRSLYDPIVSPLYGNFIGLGEIIIFSGAKDMLHPDILTFEKRLIADKADYKLHIEENLPHVYPLFPTPEASKAFELIKYEIIH